MYKVWSTYPPALWNSPRGLTLAAGTVHKVQKGTVTLANDCSFPEGTTLSHFTWMRPTPAPVKAVKLQTRTVKGSKGNTYIVRTRADGKEECSCPGYSFRRFCKHLGAQ
jgi:hypothetical protein